MRQTRFPSEGVEFEQRACHQRRERSERWQAVGGPPPLFAETAEEQLWRGLAVARMSRSRAQAEGPHDKLKK